MAAIDALRLTVAELAELVASPFAPERLSVATGTPVVVVDGADPADHPVDLGALPVVVISHRPAPWADVVVAQDHPWMDAILASVHAHPLATTALAVLLRSGHHHNVEAGLAAESAVFSLLQCGAEFQRWHSSRTHRLPSTAPELEPAVLVGRDDAVLRITLNRPRRHNAFSRQMRDGLIEALALAAADDTIEQVELAGAGPSFCSGGDLDEFGTFPDQATAHAVRLTASVARLLYRLADRVTVRLHGACLGAGIELPALAGRVVATPDVALGLPEVSLGLIPGAGGTVSVTRRIGRQRTAALALSGHPIDGPTALAWGLIDELHT